MGSINTERVGRVLGELAREHAGAQLLVSDPWAIYYLTGYKIDPGERFFGLLLAPGERPVLFNNELFPEAAFDNAETVVLSDTDDALAVVAKHVDASRALGVDATMPSGFLVPLQERRVASEFFLGSYAVTRVRSHKDAEERRLMRESSRINDEVMAEVVAAVHEGVAEDELVPVLAAAYKARGCEGYSFAPIVSFGAHAADPHHEPDGTRLGMGDVVLFDIGGRYKGYCSDMTRAFFWGEPDPELAHIYDVVRDANERAEALVAPGVRFCDIDACARNVIAEAGYGKYFTHRLGHSIGLVDHEPGDVSSANEARVEPGMTFSIEPGIYLPGKFGVRIEDLVLVCEDGAEVLNSYGKEPRRLDA